MNIGPITAMNNKRLLIDFGSTYTKVVYIDLARNEIISRARHYSTIDSDITEGLRECFKEISEEPGIDQLDTRGALASSSAAGGLSIACLGFVPEYSSEAANLAALGAGAKVVGIYSYEITRKEVEEIDTIHPDIILLTGGTDVHSLAEGRPGPGVIALGGLPEPNIRRTVEGDLGLRFNLDKLIELAKGDDPLSDLEKVARRFSVRDYTPQNREEVDCHTLLSRLAVEVALERHVGRIEVKYGPSGEMLVQHGKDFTRVGSVIGTGGPIVSSGNPREILSGALFKEQRPHILKPRGPKFYCGFGLYPVCRGTAQPDRA